MCLKSQAVFTIVCLKIMNLFGVSKTSYWENFKLLCDLFKFPDFLLAAC